MEYFLIMAYFHIFGYNPFFMKPHPYILFDGSFTGFLNAIQQGYEDSHSRILLTCSENTHTLPLFGPILRVETDIVKAQRLWGELGLLGTGIQKRVYYGFLHENWELQSEIYQYVAHLFCPEIEGIELLGIAAGRLLEGPVKEVSRERSELERKLAFKTNADGLWYSEIRPKHNILPLLSRYCRSRFSSDPWVVVDTKRKKSLSAVSGKLTLTSYTQDKQNYSRTEPVLYSGLQRVASCEKDGSASPNPKTALLQTPSAQNQDIQKWGSDWRQRAV